MRIFLVFGPNRHHHIYTHAWSGPVVDVPGAKHGRVTRVSIRTAGTCLNPYAGVRTQHRGECIRVLYASPAAQVYTSNTYFPPRVSTRY